MAKSYTPGLKILNNTEIERERKLPLKGDINCNKGDFVKNDTIVASTKLPGNIHMINIASQLNIDSSSLKDYLIVKIDQLIKKDEVIAENKGFFGFFKTQVKSPIEGKISNISLTTGQIMISEPDIPIEVDAYIDGEVKNIINNEGVIIRSNGCLVQGIIGVGGEKNGELFFWDDQESEDIDEKIIVIKGPIDKKMYDSLSDRGALGVVAGGFDYKSLSDILGYRLGVAITGTETISTTLIITEGFGDVEMSSTTYELLKKYNKSHASINGATQIRAGVIRPEVIIPSVNKEDSIKFFDENDLVIKEGSNVRVIREPYFGKIGTVKKLPSEPFMIESETKARVAEVEFDNKERKLVPRANLEIILD